MLILTRADVRRLIEMEPVIAAVEAAHVALADGRASQAIDHATALPGGDGVMLPMAAAIAVPAVVGTKLLADVPSNAGRALRTQHSTITLIDPVTGRCRGFLDGIEITLHRTAAASAVATRALARPDVRTLGLIGAGNQARSHVQALRAVREFDRVVVWSRRYETAERFAAEERADGLVVEVRDSPEAVVRAADVLCTLTPSRDPIVRGLWFTPGMHVNAVGAPPRPDHREIDSVGIARSRVIVDDVASSLDRSGEVCVPIAEGTIDRSHIAGDLGAVLTGRCAGRTSADEITLFNSVGLALQDMATAAYLLAAAEACGVGLEVDLQAEHAPPSFT